jgi:hypothetical protein
MYVAGGSGSGPNIALIRGDWCGYLTKQDAIGLWYLIYKFYVSDTHFEQVKLFNSGSSAFQFDNAFPQCKQQQQQASS